MIVAGVGSAGLLGAAAATANTDNEVVTPTMPLTNETIVLPGAFDTVYQPYDDVINFPFGGDGEINFLSPGNPGISGLLATGLITAVQQHELITPVYEWTLPFLNDTIVFPDSDDTIILPADNTIDLPFADDGEIMFFGNRIAGIGGAGLPGNADDGVATPLDQSPTALASDTATTITVLPGSDDTIALLSGDTVNLPFGGVGEINLGGSGNGGNGGISPVATPLDQSPTTLANDTTAAITVLPGSDHTIALLSGDTVNLPFGGVGEINLGGGGNGGNGGDASGGNAVGGIGGSGGTGLLGAPGGAGGAGEGTDNEVIWSAGGPGGDGGNAPELFASTDVGNGDSFDLFGSSASAMSHAWAGDLTGLESDFMAFDPFTWLGLPL